MKMLTNLCIKISILFLFIFEVKCKLQAGPDPWDLHDNDKVNQIESDLDIPPDLRSTPKKQLKVGNGSGPDEWFYKRLLAIMLKAGHVKVIPF